MKLSVEIKDDKFIYDYQIGTSKQHGNFALNAENFLYFNKLLHDCQKATLANHNAFCAEITAKSYMEKYPDSAQEYLNKVIKGS